MEVGSSTGYKRETLVEMLQLRDVTVTFEKVDGSTRVMHATLQADVIPELGMPGAHVNNNIITVWDLDVQDWRSFRVDSVKDVL